MFTHPIHSREKALEWLYSLKIEDLRVLGNIWLALGWWRLSVGTELKAHKLSWNLLLIHCTERKRKFANVRQSKTARNLKGKETKRHMTHLENIQPKVPLLCNPSQGCHYTEVFESPVAPFSTPRAKLLLCSWILSRTGFFTCGMKGKWSILSRDRCYRPLMTALSLNHLSVVLICCRLMVLFTGLLIGGEFLCNKQHSEGTCHCRKRLSSISEEGWSLW